VETEGVIREGNMKNLNELNKNRIKMFGYDGDESNGAFRFRIKGNDYLVIASNGGGWEHVSVSCISRVPSWEIMCEIKDMFFNEDEVVMQLHPAKKDYVNNHPNCLHLWKPLNKKIPTPPSIMVGLKEFNLKQ